MEDRQLSLSEVAGLMGVSERTIRRWIKSGKLKAYKPGRDYRIPESAVREFVEESEVSPKAGRRSSLEPTLFNGLEDERRKAIYGSWLEFANRYAERWERRLDAGDFDLGSMYEFIRVYEDVWPVLGELNRAEVRELPPQPYSFGIPAAKTGQAIGRLLDLINPMIEAGAAKFNDSELDELVDELEPLRRKREEREAALEDGLREGA
jgi:excisionase family DNA binding protein